MTVYVAINEIIFQFYLFKRHLLLLHGSPLNSSPILVALTDQFEEKKCKNSRVILPIRKTKTKTITISQYIFIQFEKKTDYFQFFHYIQISSVKKLKN